MKKYLWAGIAVLFVCAHASDNPFDLKENFGKLDQDQEVLLSELKKLAELKELAADKELEEAEVVEVPEDIPTFDSINEVAESLSKVLDDESEETNSNVVEPKDVEVVAEIVLEEKKVEGNQAFMESLISTETVEEKKVINAEIQDNKAFMKEIVSTETELKTTNAAKVNIQEEERKQLEAKKEAERLEVEAYEKKRAEKLAEQQRKDLEVKRLAEEEAKVKKLAQEQEVKKIADAEAKKVQAMKVVVPVNMEAITSIDDINLTREKLEATLAANAAYEAAVKEMSKED